MWLDAQFKITISHLHSALKNTDYRILIYFIATPYSFSKFLSEDKQNTYLAKKVYTPPLLFMKYILEGWCIQWLFLLLPFRQIVLPMHIIFIIVILGWIFLILSWTASIFDVTKKKLFSKREASIYLRSYILNLSGRCNMQYNKQ